jgi:hypothetical protein
MSSSYADDPRVVRTREGRYDLPSPENWRVSRSRYGGWEARSDDGPAMDPSDRHCKRRERFGTADEAIRHVIGDPEPGDAQ